MTETASRLPRLTAADAVHYLLMRHGIPVAKSTLKQWAWRGGGPGYQKAGPRRLYPIEELDAWAGQRLTRVVASTSELTSLLTIGREPGRLPANVLFDGRLNLRHRIQGPAPVTDIVERLRMELRGERHADLARAAADEIERLREILRKVWVAYQDEGPIREIFGVELDRATRARGQRVAE